MANQPDVLTVLANFDSLIAGFNAADKAAIASAKTIAKAATKMESSLQGMAKISQANAAIIDKALDIDPLVTRLFSGLRKLDVQWQETFQRNVPKHIKATIAAVYELTEKGKALTLVDKQKVQEAINLIEEFNKAAKKVSIAQAQSQIQDAFGFGGAAPAIQKTTQATSGLTGALGKIFPAFTAAFAVRAIFNTVINLIKKVISSAINMIDTFKAARETLIGIGAAAGKSIAEVDATMLNLVKLSRDLNTSISDTIGVAGDLQPVLAAANVPTDQLEAFIKLAGQLGAISTTAQGGIKGAIVSIADLLTGDFISIKRRFNLQADQIKAIMAATNVSAAAGVKELLDQIGYTAEVGAKANLTIANTMERIGDSAAYVAAQILGPFADMLVNIGDTLVNNLTSAGLMIAELENTDQFVTKIYDQLKLTLGVYGNLAKMITASDLLQPIFKSLTDMFLGVKLNGFEGAFDTPMKKILAIFVNSISQSALVLSKLTVSFGHTQLAANQLAIVFLKFARLMEQISKPFSTTPKIDSLIANAEEHSAVLAENIANASAQGQLIYDNWVSMLKTIQNADFSFAQDPANIPAFDAPDTKRFTEEMIIAFQEMQNSIIEADAKYAQERLNLIAEFNKDDLEQSADFYLKRKRAQEDFDDDQLEAEHKLQDKINDIVNGKDSEASKLISKRQEETITKTIKYNNDLEDLEAKHKARIEELTRDHQTNIEDAAAKLDAFGVQKENDRFQDALSDEQRRYEDEKAKLAARLEEEISMKTAAFQEELRIAREHDAQKIADLRSEFAQEQAMRQAEFDKKQQRELEDFLKEKERRQADLEERLKLLDEQKEQEIRELKKRFAAEMVELDQHNNNMLGIHRAGLDAVAEQLKEWWAANAEAFLPPDFEIEAPTEPTEPTDTTEPTEPTDTTEPTEEDKKKRPWAYDVGGKVGSTQLAMLHQGERVLTSKTARALENQVFEKQLLSQTTNNRTQGGSIGNLTIVVGGQTENITPENIGELVQQGLLEALQRV